MAMGVVCCCSYTSFHLDSSMLLPKLQGRELTSIDSSTSYPGSLKRCSTRNRRRPVGCVYIVNDSFIFCISRGTTLHAKRKQMNLRKTL
jgi:hypothetical protein